MYFGSVQQEIHGVCHFERATTIMFYTIAMYDLYNVRFRAALFWRSFSFSGTEPFSKVYAPHMIEPLRHVGRIAVFNQGGRYSLIARGDADAQEALRKMKTDGRPK